MDGASIFMIHLLLTLAFISLFYSFEHDTPRVREEGVSSLLSEFDHFFTEAIFFNPSVSRHFLVSRARVRDSDIAYRY